MFTVCGDRALDPEGVSELCREHPHDEVYCVPWVKTEDDLRENLTVNRGRPNRVFPCEPYEELLDGESVDIKKELNGDVYGRMAFLLKNGTPVVNQVMRTPCRSDFYGNIMDVGPGAKRYIVSQEDVDRYFPSEPLSIKLYAATTVFVRMSGTDEFAELAGNNDVDVLIATPFMPGAQEFMGFLRLMTGTGLAASIRPDETFPRKKIGLFRYNKGYSVLFDDYVEMFERETC